jgi:ribosomal protein S27E
MAREIRHVGKLVAVTFEIACPFCTESLAEPASGSFLWTSDDVGKHAGTVVVCPNGHRITVPPEGR